MKDEYRIGIKAHLMHDGYRWYPWCRCGWEPSSTDEDGYLGRKTHEEALQLGLEHLDRGVHEGR